MKINLKKYKHSILTVCYNQEKFLAEMFNSILTPQNIPYEIIIADDCSTDNSRKIILQYQSHYPSIIKPIFREKNLGITNNLNDIYTKPSGDIISFVAGDDFISEGLLYKIDTEVSNYGLNPTKDKFMALPVVANLYKNGRLKYFNNNYIWSNPEVDKLSLAIRHKIITQNVGISAALFREWPRFDQDSFDKFGIYSDFPIYIQIAMICDHYVRVDGEFAFHRCDVGITSKDNKIRNRISYNLAATSILQQYKLKSEDQNYLLYEISKNNFYEGKKFSYALIFTFLWIKTFFIEKINFKEVFFDMLFAIWKSTRIHIFLNKLKKC